MGYVDCNSVEIRERQRTLDAASVGKLKDSILRGGKGLLQAPVVARDDRGLFLVAGAHRLTAIRELHEEGHPIFFDGNPIPPGQLPVIHLHEMAIADLMEAELEENIIRTELPWQDRARALAAIHALRVEANPEQTVTDTARELIEKGAPLADRQMRKEMRNSVLLAENLHRPSVAKARNATEAMGILLKEETARIESELLQRRRKAASSVASLCTVRHGDMQKLLPEIDPGTFDLIIADLPYGIKADGFRDRTVEHHNYEDSPEIAKQLLTFVISEGFRVTKPRANLLLFGDVDLFPLFKTACGGMGWKAFRTPIIWRKSESEGLAPWGREGFRRTYEMIFFATKGNKGLFQSPVDILEAKRVARNLRRYGPEKPVDLLEQLIEAASMPGDYVLDPCCGAGSTLIACRHLKRRGLGIELDEAAYHMAVVAAERDPNGEADAAEAEDLA